MPERRGVVRSADNTVHDLIAISNDLRRHVDGALAARGYDDRRPSFAPLLARVWTRGVAQGRLADALGVSPQAASQTIGLAVEAGYVTRRTNPDDRRSKLVAVSERGREFVTDGAAAIAARAGDYAAAVGPRPYARFERTLQRLRFGLAITDDAWPVSSGEPRAAVIAVSLLAEHAMGELRSGLHDGGHDEISASQNLVLVHIGPDGARSSELARAQQVSRQAVSAILRDLEELGYVGRRGDPDDARGVVFEPTRRGRALLDTYVAGIDALERRYAEVVDGEHFAELAHTAQGVARWVLLDRGLSAAADDRPDPVSPTVERPDGELAGLAADLWSSLGEHDAVRLAAMLRQLARDGSPAHRATGTD